MELGPLIVKVDLCRVRWTGHGFELYRKAAKRRVAARHDNNVGPIVALKPAWSLATFRWAERIWRISIANLRRRIACCCRCVRLRRTRAHLDCESPVISVCGPWQGWPDSRGSLGPMNFHDGRALGEWNCWFLWNQQPLKSGFYGGTCRWCRESSRPGLEL